MAIEEDRAETTTEIEGLQVWHVPPIMVEEVNAVVNLSTKMVDIVAQGVLNKGLKFSVAQILSGDVPIGGAEEVRDEVVRLLKVMEPQSQTCQIRKAGC